MDCPEEIKQFIVDSLANGLSEDKWDLVEEHIIQNEDCYEFLQAQLKLSEALKSPEAKELLKENVRFLIVLAEKHKEEGNLTKAIKCLEEVLELRPGDEEIERKFIELIQTNSGDPLRRNFIVRVNDKITEYEIAGNELNFYLYKAVGEIEDKNVTVTKDDEIYFSRSFEEKDIRIYRLAADTGEAKDKKSKARVIKGVDFKRKPYRKINYRTYINPDEGYAKVIIELPS